MTDVTDDYTPPADEYAHYRPPPKKLRKAAQALEEERQPKTARHREADRAKQTKGALYFLTPQELKFVKAVATGMNHAEAAKLAGFRGDGGRGASRGWALMKKPVVRAALYELMVDAFDKAGIETAQWLREVASIAFMPDHLVEGKLRYADKLKALEMVGNFQKLLDRTAPAPRSEVNIINLITQSVAKKDVTAILEKVEAVAVPAATIGG